MQSQAWDSAAPEPQPFALRPLSTGEAMDRSFALLRASFLTCVGIGLLPALLTVVQMGTRLIYLKAAHLSTLTPAWSTPTLAVLSTLFSILSFFLVGWSSAAICWAASQRYLGRPATIRDAYGMSLRHWFRYPALLVLQLLRSAYLPIVLYIAAFAMIGYSSKGGGLTLRLLGASLMLLAFCSIFLAMYLYIRLSLAMPVAVLEDLGPTAAIRRSKELLQTRKGRVFLVLLLIGVFYFVLSMCVGVVGMAFIRGHAAMLALQAAGLLTALVSSTLLQPLLMVALTVIYYDERVRRDGYDLLVLMERPEAEALPVTAFPDPNPPATL